jgi:uncharacterized membrane protein YbhN (UPF0104 family)
MNRSVIVRQSPPELAPDLAPELAAAQAGGPVAGRFPTRAWIFAGLLVAGLAAGLTGAGLADVDVAGGLWDGAGWLSDGAARIRWGLVPVIVALTALHYLISALGVRATASGAAGRRDTVRPSRRGRRARRREDRDAATRRDVGASDPGGRLGVWEVTTAQFAGAAANRLAPAGLGTAAVTCRYLTRRGVPACAATTTVAVVGLVRALTKLALVALAISLWNGFGQALRPAADMGRAASRHSAVVVPVAIGVAAVVTVIVAVALCWRRGRMCVRIGTALVGVGRSLRHLVRRPGCLLALFAAATAADLALALAFAMSVMAVPGVPTGSVFSLIALYLLGATAGAAVPMPAGVGSTEAALIAALATVHIPAAQAATGVFLFRIMTFWAPVPAGILSTRWLRRRGGL